MLYSVSLIYTCEIQNNNVLQMSRACKSEFIAKNPLYNSSDIEAKINKEENLIELYANKKRSIRGDVSISFIGDTYYKLGIGYKKFLLEYGKGKKEDINIDNISLGYEYSYSTSIASFYIMPNIGYAKYSIDTSINGFFVASRLGVRKEVFGVSVNIFGDFQKDFIDEFSLNIMSFGVGIGF